MENFSQSTSGPDIQQALKALFKGVVPERAGELSSFWDKYQLEFHLMDDGTLPVVEAGLYKQVRYNHRLLCAIWAGTFAAWEGYSAIHQAISRGEECNLVRFKEMLGFVEAVKVEDDPMIIWDSHIPKPGVLVSAEDSVEKRAVAELAMFATAWVMLHEMRHIQHQQDDTSATWGSKEERHAEELSCDEFATRFITEKVDAYSEESGYPNDKVMLKRKSGIYVALFALTLLGKDNWSETDWHPAVQLRLDAVFKLLGGSTVDPALAIAVGAFEALKLVCPLAPVIHFVS